MVSTAFVRSVRWTSLCFSMSLVGHGSFTFLILSGHSRTTSYQCSGPTLKSFYKISPKIADHVADLALYSTNSFNMFIDTIDLEIVSSIKRADISQQAIAPSQVFPENSRASCAGDLQPVGWWITDGDDLVALVERSEKQVTGDVG